MDNVDFDEVLISPAMIQDHMPDTVLLALNKVSQNASLYNYVQYNTCLIEFNMNERHKTEFKWE